MNVAFVHYAYINGGLERITLDIIKYLSSAYNNKYKFFLYSIIFDDGRRAELESYNVTTRKLRKEKTLRTIDTKTFLINDKIDLVVQSSFPIWNIENIQKETGVKVIFANHGEPFWERFSLIRRKQSTRIKRLRWKLYRKHLYRILNYPMRRTIRKTKAIYRKCDAYTVLCEPYKTQMCKAFKIKPENSHIYAIENPEYAVEKPNLNKEKMILFCGRLENTSKRVDLLLEIWQKIQDKLPDWRLVLIGEGPNEIELKNMAQELNLHDIYFIGAVKNPSTYYRRASIVCLTSQTEGWGLALTEGQAHGCIPIAFACSDGVKIIIGEDQTTGFLVKPGDIEAYADTLVKVAQLPEEQKIKIREAAIKKRLKYTPEIMGQKWNELFDSLVHSIENN